MDIQKSREGLRVLEDAAKNATPALRMAILSAVDVAKAAIAEVEKGQQDAALFLDEARGTHDEIMRAADAAEERAEVAENALASYKAQEHKKSITKAQETEKAAVLKSIAALGEQLKAVTPLLATMMAARAYCKRADNGLNIIADARPYGQIECSFPNGETTIVEMRKHAMLLAEAWTRNYIDKIGPGINVDVEEDHPATQANGAPAVWPPPADLDGYAPERRLFGPGSPRVVED